MDKDGLTQDRLASRLKVDQPQISRWLKGAKPNGANFETILNIARTQGVIDDVRSEDVAAALPSGPRAPTVKLKGYVGAGAEAHFYAISDEDFEPVEAPIGATDRTVALEIRGKSWGPVMDSWLVFYDDVRSPITSDLLGEVCVVGLADDRILIKEVRSNGQGGFDLFPNSTIDEVIRDADIEWAAKVVGMRPR